MVTIKSPLQSRLMYKMFIKWEAADDAKVPGLHDSASNRSSMLGDGTEGNDITLASAMYSLTALRRYSTPSVIIRTVLSGRLLNL